MENWTTKKTKHRSLQGGVLISKIIFYKIPNKFYYKVRNRDCSQKAGMS